MFIVRFVYEECKTHNMNVTKSTCNTYRLLSHHFHADDARLSRPHGRDAGFSTNGASTLTPTTTTNATKTAAAAAAAKTAADTADAKAASRVRACIRVVERRKRFRKDVPTTTTTVVAGGRRF
jgi:hypothetical protein